jgi:hypothetical protein
MTGPRRPQSIQERSKTIMPTTQDRLARTREVLAQAGITLVVNTGIVTRGDAWCDAVEKHGEKIAHLYIEDGAWRHGEPWQQELGHQREWHPLRMLKVSYPYKNHKMGFAIARVLKAAGLNVQWSGDATQAIQIHLDQAGAR